MISFSHHMIVSLCIVLKQEEKGREIVQSCDPLTFTEDNHKLYLHCLLHLLQKLLWSYVHIIKPEHTH